MKRITFLAFILVTLLCTCTIVSGQTTPTDAELLNATPIPGARMELIWLDPPKLEDLAKKVKGAGGKMTVEYYDAADNHRREYETTWSDIVWAKEVEKIIDVAWAAGNADQLDKAIKYYKQALVLAPGGDLPNDTGQPSGFADFTTPQTSMVGAVGCSAWFGGYTICPVLKLTEKGRQPAGGSHSPSPRMTPSAT